MTTEFKQNFVTLTEDELVDVGGGAVISATICVSLFALSYTIGKDLRKKFS
ncbi:bacteriocin [Streptococcus koreensis]|jgi:hypothetical protein|uniref:Bacteriocin n=1 Tax=Streptococcus koreensis TaxID=2382163 RepID=A0ABM6Z8M7_9STRE|nr:bacteriocin [Streptococcus koreensis]AYF93601.1 bacteriocin [Streptococcus koreensis]